MTTGKTLQRKQAPKAKMYEEKKLKYIINITIKSQQMPNTGIGNNGADRHSLDPDCSYGRVYDEGQGRKLPNRSVAIIHEKLTSMLEVYLFLNIPGPL